MEKISKCGRHLLGRSLGAGLTLLLLPLLFFAHLRPVWRLALALALGQLHWIGPSGTGVISSWRLHERLGLPGASEAALDAADEQARGWAFDSALVGRYVWACLLGGQRPVSMSERWPLLGLWLDNLNHQEILGHLDRWKGSSACRRIAFVNPHCANLASRDPLYRCILNRADLLLPDGSGVLLAGRLLRTPMRANSNGTDLFPVLCEYWQKNGARLYLLGGREGVAAAVAERLAVEYPGLALVGHHHGYFSESETPALLDEIREAKPDVLVVAMGVPLQDVWLAEHEETLSVPLAIGVGGLFDFYSGRIARAPLWLRELGLEWTWRLAMEPARMWRRYLVGNVTFLLRVVKQRLKRPLLPAAPTRNMTRSTPGDAVLLATHPLWYEEIQGLNPLMLPVAGLTILERTLIALAEQGAKHVHILANADLSEIQELVGDGARWGVQISWHYRGPEPLQQRLNSLSLESVVWIVAPGCLPSLPLPTIEARWVLRDGLWSGWARANVREIASIVETVHLPLHGPQFNGVSVRTPGELLQAQKSLIRSASNLPPAYREVKNQVWLAPGAVLEPGAQVVGPVMIGEGSLIRSGSCIGPNVVIGAGCVLDSAALCHNALLLANSYVSQHLTLEHVIAGANLAYDVRSKATVFFSKADAILSNIAPVADPVGWRERLQAVALHCALRFGSRPLTPQLQQLRERLRDVWHGQRHLIGLPELPVGMDGSTRPRLRSGAIALSDIMPHLPPPPGVSEVEQRQLLDLYGAVTADHPSWMQLYSYYSKWAR